jgi:hypothetical protein
MVSEFTAAQATHAHPATAPTEESAATSGAECLGLRFERRKSIKQCTKHATGAFSISSRRPTAATADSHTDDRPI